ncbi:hypothetical protein ANANG_G00019760 [Anguilla anguilla]|uniref:Uncharacterized protein n=1 Tax=Anguilla anguilla TaxID=7936 RepID=A0A9D3N149_ANGAN|nr:hypothetical protein ANANG_G00019760 [Anguilla anguilla]
MHSGSFLESGLPQNFIRSCALNTVTGPLKVFPFLPLVHGPAGVYHLWKIQSANRGAAEWPRAKRRRN